jgi:DNA polymerase-3 subunit epsilon
MANVQKASAVHAGTIGAALTRIWGRKPIVPLPPPASEPPEQADYPAAWASLPRKIFFVDVEATGFGRLDRIVSLGVVRLTTEPIDIATLHLIFNPQCRCSLTATNIHGLDNATLARQDDFAPYAPALSAYLSRADLIVAHNAAFDVRVLNSEFALRRLPAIGVPTACTMLEYRAREQANASIEDIVARLGLKRQATPSALEDAWLTMQTFLWLRGCPYRLDFSAVGDPGPANFRDALPA